MSNFKDKRIVKNAAAFFSNQKMNITFTVSVTPARPEYFAKVVEGKVAIRILDFSEAENKIASARIDIEYVPYLLACANRLEIPEKFYEQKIFGDPDRNGMAKMTILTISHSNGKWGIAVQNGRGKKIKTKTGGFYAEKGSFKESSNLFFSLSNADFLFALQSCADYILLQKQIIGVQNGEIVKNLTDFEKQQDTYQNNLKNQSTGPQYQVEALSEVRLSTKEKAPYFYAKVDNKKCILFLENGNVPIKTGELYSIQIVKKDKDKCIVSVL